MTRDCRAQPMWSSIEVVITSTTGNRVAVKSGPRVRIPPTPPEPQSLIYQGLRFFLVFSAFSWVSKCKRKFPMQQGKTSFQSRIYTRIAHGTEQKKATPTGGALCRLPAAARIKWIEKRPRHSELPGVRHGQTLSLSCLFRRAARFPARSAMERRPASESWERAVERVEEDMPR